jgi:adenylate cyclase
VNSVKGRSGRRWQRCSRPIAVGAAPRVQGGALRHGAGETIRATLLCADLCDFTALSEATDPAAMIVVLDAWFDRIAGAVHAFGGEVLKFIGDGVLAIFPVTGAPAETCGTALRAVTAARAGMASRYGAAGVGAAAATLRRGAAFGRDTVGQYRRGRPARLYRDPAVNLVSRPEGLCRPLGRSVLLSGAVAAETTTPLVLLGEHPLRGIPAAYAVFTLPDA